MVRACSASAHGVDDAERRVLRHGGRDEGWEIMSELLALAGINVTVTVAFAAFIWRNQVQAERRNDAAHADLSRRIDNLAESVGSRIDGLTAEVAGLGQRLARLEGWIERDRVGQEQS